MTMMNSKAAAARQWVRTTAYALPLLAITMAVQAQTQTQTANPPLLQPSNPQAPLPASGTEGGYFFNLRPVGAEFGKTLADHGIYLTGRDLSEGIGQVSGGNKRGAFFEGYTALGTDLDMARIAGIPGGVVHVLFSDVQGAPYAPYSGSSYLNNRVYANGPAFRMNELSYEQSLFDDQFDLRLGRVTIGTEFDNSELYCTFISSLCSTPTGYTFDKGYPAYTTSFWGAITQTKLPAHLYFNAAVYENEPVLATHSHHALPGRDFGLNFANGATIPAQFGYRTTFKDSAYPSAYSVGGFFATGTYADPVRNTANRDRILFRGTPKTDNSRSGIYVQAQQMVYRPDSTTRGLSLFGGANWATGGQGPVERDVFAGASFRGPFSVRPNDTVGAAVTYVGVNPRVSERIDDVLSRTTHGQVSRSEVSYQINYGLAVAPGVDFKPFFEFISHPDQAALAVPRGSITHAIFVGAALSVLLPETLGLPRLAQR